MSGIALSTIEWLRAGAPLLIPGSGWPVLSDPPDPTPATYGPLPRRGSRCSSELNPHVEVVDAQR